MATVIVPPRSVLRFIDPPHMSRFLVVYWMNEADITMKKRHIRFWPDCTGFCRRPPCSDSPQGSQDNLRRQRNLRNYRPERLQRIIYLVGHRLGRPPRTGLSRTLCTQLGL